jgi:hypothetical protein
VVLKVARFVNINISILIIINKLKTNNMKRNKDLEQMEEIGFFLAIMAASIVAGLGFLSIIASVMISSTK